MNIHIKSHLLAELIVLIIAVVILYFAIYYTPLNLPSPESWQMLFLGAAAMVGAFNTVYLFAHLCIQNYISKIRKNRILEFSRILGNTEMLVKRTICRCIAIV